MKIKALDKLTSLRQRQLTLGQYLICYLLLTLLLHHYPLLSYVVDNIEPVSIEGAEIGLSILLIFYFASYLILALAYLFSAYLVKLFCVSTTIINAALLFFIHNYGIEIDQVLISNIVNTRYSEASELINLELIVTVTLLGIIPAVMLALVKIKRVKRRQTLFGLIKVTALTVPALYLMSGSWLWIDKHASKVGSLLLPWAYIVDFTRYQVSRYQAQQEQVLLPKGHFTKQNKTLVVLVIGETARKANFGLYGYAKNTTPKLTNESLLALNNTSSCTTYTTASIKCMLSHQTQEQLFATEYEYLPSYLKRHDIDVIWHSNNWGEPAIEVNTYNKAETLRQNCQGTGCDHDEVLLQGLSERIINSKQQRIFVVLHQKGSHGPLYHERHPKAFEQFSPGCHSLNIRDCSYQELVNAYDNTILYTDHFLSRVIATLKQITETPSMMMYISDHGESLGEYGLYLHGTPKSVAPAYQFDIPFLIWMTPELKARKAIDFDTFEQQSKYGQDHVFHTIMGAFDLISPVYDKSKDLFSDKG